MKNLLRNTLLRNASSSHKNIRKGFTLIELLVAIGIFSIFIVIMTGVFSNFIEVERHSIEQGALILEMQSVIESFVKEARTSYGSTFDVTPNGDQIFFRNQQSGCVSYRLATSRFERAEDPGNRTGSCDGNSFNNDDFTRLSSNNVEISDVLFVIEISDVDGNDDLKNQGFITLVMTGNSTKDGIAPITIQNSATSRQVTIPPTP